MPMTGSFHIQIFHRWHYNYVILNLIQKKNQSELNFLSTQSLMTFLINKCHLSRDYRFLKELKARNLFHTSVLTDESKLNEYGTAVRLTWGGDVSALHFFFGVTDTERVKRHQVAENILLTGILQVMIINCP